MKAGKYQPGPAPRWRSSGWLFWVWGGWPGGISFILFAETKKETEKEGEPVMSGEHEEFKLGSVFKVAGVIALVVFGLGMTGLLSNL